MWNFFKKIFIYKNLKFVVKWFLLFILFTNTNPVEGEGRLYIQDTTFESGIKSITDHP
jgi:hypothetical protein